MTKCGKQEMWRTYRQDWRDLRAKTMSVKLTNFYVPPILPIQEPSSDVCEIMTFSHQVFKPMTLLTGLLSNH